MLNLGSNWKGLFSKRLKESIYDPQNYLTNPVDDLVVNRSLQIIGDDIIGAGATQSIFSIYVGATEVLKYSKYSGLETDYIRSTPYYYGKNGIWFYDSGTWSNIFYYTVGDLNIGFGDREIYLSEGGFGVLTTGNYTGNAFISQATTGTSPYACTSTTLNTNLNADLLDGNHAAAFAVSAHTHVLTAGATDVTATKDELNVLDGIPATLTATELGYVDGVTSAIQTQLDARLKLDTSNDPLTGNLEISKADPEFRLTDTGDSEYCRWTRTDTNKEVDHKARVDSVSSYSLASSGKTYTSTPAAHASYPDTGGTEMTDGTLGSINYADGLSAGWLTTAPTIRIDLSSAQDLAYVRFHYLVQTADGLYAPDSVVISGSNNDSSWDTLGTFNQSGNWVTTDSNVYWTNNLNVAGSYRYVKFAFTAGGQWTFLSELEVYKTTAGTTSEVTYLSVKNGTATPEKSTITLGNADSRTIVQGKVFYLTGIPTADPHVAGQLWANSGVVTVSAG